MGSCYSSTTSSAAISQDTKNQQQHARQGAEGLLDYGFEYRLYQPCSKHAPPLCCIATSGCEDNEQDHPEAAVRLRCTDCSIRLLRIQDNALITTLNRKEYIPPRIYDPVARLAQQTVISWLQRDYQLQSLPLFTTTTADNKNDGDSVVVQALVSHPPPSTTCSSGSTLLIINGRGVARAGILSTRHTIESGIEKGSAVYHIDRAMQEHKNNQTMAVVCLDSNARGSIQGLDTICRSLVSQALAPYLSNGRALYILCHSAAGGNFVQHLLKTDNTTTSSSPTTTTADSITPQQQQQQHPPLFTVEQIKALVFTDSTHDLQWLSLQSNPKVVDFLQSDTCLYIRNNREHASYTYGPNHKDKPAGETFSCRKTNEQWKKRFGSIRTVYAGTTDHSLMCYQARDIIWDFINSKRNEQEASCEQQQQHLENNNNNNNDDKTKPQE